MGRGSQPQAAVGSLLPQSALVYIGPEEISEPTTSEQTSPEPCHEITTSDASNAQVEPACLGDLKIDQSTGGGFEQQHDLQLSQAQVGDDPAEPLIEGERFLDNVQVLNMLSCRPMPHWNFRDTFANNMALFNMLCRPILQRYGNE